MKTCNDRSGRDKFYHFAVSACIAVVLAAIFSLVPCSPWTAAISVFWLTMVAGIAKEIHDARQPGNHFCVWDLAFDALGALLGAAVAYPANLFSI